MSTYEIGPLQLDPRSQTLTHGSELLSLGPRAIALLQVLIEHAEQTVPKSTLLTAAWPRVIVSEGNLTVQISTIRRILRQAGHRGWIQTVSRRGYRYVGPAPRLLLTGSTRTNLPVQDSSFIGRHAELAQLIELVQRTQLLTLVGAGGIGKTRLALELCAQLRDRYADGVWLIELSALTDGEMVVPAIAQTLGLADRRGRLPVRALQDWLCSRKVLLLLDGCEHLLPAVRSLADTLLNGTSGATILATSREAVRAAGEHLYPVSPLSLPAAHATTEEVARSEAVQLFMERAREQQADFDPDVNAAQVADLCHRLDGMPLALELAAARLRELSVDQITERIDDRLRQLQTAQQSMPRHQTLRAVTEWSFDLLGHDERRVLRRAAVFVGGFTRANAVALAGDDGADDAAAVDTLDRLVRRSLVVAEGSGSMSRYRLLETTLACALEKLADAGEAGACRRRHAEHFRDRCVVAHARLGSTSDAEWTAAYLPDIHNVQAALEWAFGSEGDVHVGIQLVCAGMDLWKYASDARSAHLWIDRALAHVAAVSSDDRRALLWLRAADHWNQVGPQQRFELLTRAVELYGARGDETGLLVAQTRRGHMLALHGRLDEAEEALGGVLPADETTVAPRILAEYLYACGALAMMRGDSQAAKGYCERALAACRRVGAERLALIIVGNLADLIWMSGDLDRAETMLREAVEHARAQGPIGRQAMSATENNLIGVLAEKGAVTDALALARRADTFVHEPQVAWAAMDHLALCAGLDDRLEDAAQLVGFTDHRFETERMTRQPNEARARQRIGAKLQAALPADLLTALHTRGASLSAEAACALALRA